MQATWLVSRSLRYQTTFFRERGRLHHTTVIVYTSVKRGLDLLSNYRSMDHAAISGHMSFTSCHFLFCFVFYHSHLVDYSVILISRRFVPVPSVIYFSSFRQAASATCLLIKIKLYMIVPPPPPPPPDPKIGLL